jgi:hypothetical protein
MSSARAQALGVIAIAETIMETPEGATSTMVLRGTIDRLLEVVKAQQTLLSAWESSFAGHVYIPVDEYACVCGLAKDAAEAADSTLVIELERVRAAREAVI